MASLLPTQIPPQTVPFCVENATGQLIVDINWYLFLYKLWTQVLSTAAGAVILTPAITVPIIDIDVISADFVQTARQLTNTALLQPDQDVGPTLRDMLNALMIGLDSLLLDPIPTAQPSVAVTVLASPFIYTAAFNGTLAVSAGTVSAIAVIRQGVTVATGLTSGLIPVSRSDKVQITYTVVPTAVFLQT